MNLQTALQQQPEISRYTTLLKDGISLYPQNQYLNKSFELLRSFQPIITDVSLFRCNQSYVETLRISSVHTRKKHAQVCQIFMAINQLCLRLFHTDLVQIVLSQHGSNTIALKWASDSANDVSLFMVGDSTKGVGLLKLVGDQVLDYRATP